MHLFNTTWRGQGKEVRVWDGEQLGGAIAIDTETDMQPFHTDLHKMICFQAYDGSDKAYYVRLRDVDAFMRKHLESRKIAQNFPFDWDVIERHSAYRFHDDLEADRLWDTQIMYRLLRLATVGQAQGRSSLANITEELLGEVLDKDEAVRCTFDQYAGMEPEQMDRAHLDYAIRDVFATFDCYERLRMRTCAIDGKSMLTHRIQLAGAYALNRVYKNGILFDLEMRDEFMEKANQQFAVQEFKLANYGWVRGAKGLKSRYESIMEHLGIAHLLPRSDNSGDLSSKREDLEEFADRHEFVKTLLDYTELEKATTFVRDIDSERVHPRYNFLVNTGRTSCSKPNFQQLPRVGGIREMFRAAPGNTFIITDYSTLELATLAQVLKQRFGRTVMGDLINAGEDLHKYYASVLYNVPMEKVTKDQRQSAKAANFGFPGGLGIETFITFARSYGLSLDEEEAQAMKDAWFQAFPEMEAYMKAGRKTATGYDKEKKESYDLYTVKTLTGRQRARATFCAEKNTPFQGLAADGAKIALYYLHQAGFRVVGFVHDEIICEVAAEDAERLKVQMEDIMIRAMNVVVPDIKISVESQISDRYCK